MNAPLLPDPNADAMLSELAALGMRAARVVVRLMEIEQAAAEVSAAWLPVAGVEPDSLEAAAAAGRGVDAVSASMALAVPRVEGLARALERVSRGVRRCVALRRRLEAGWPRAAADTRGAMVRRQVARGVAEVIRRERQGEAAERLFDDLDERLDALAVEVDGLPVVEVVRRICRDLGLVGHEGVRGTTVPLRGVGQSPAALPDDG